MESQKWDRTEATFTFTFHSCLDDFTKEISEQKSQKGEYIMHESVYIKFKNRQN